MKSDVKQPEIRRLAVLVSGQGLKLQRNEGGMKKPWSILPAILIGVVALVGGGFLLAGIFVVMLFLGGPYSDAQYGLKRHTLITNITLMEGTVFPLHWDVDDRFVVEFDNGFVLKRGTKLSDFPDSFSLEEGMGSFRDGKPLGKYNVWEKGVSDSVMSVFVDENQVVLRAYIGISDRSTGSFKDLNSQKSFRLHDNSYDDVVRFFESLPN